MCFPSLSLAGGTDLVDVNITRFGVLGQGGLVVDDSGVVVENTNVGFYAVLCPRQNLLALVVGCHIGLNIGTAGNVFHTLRQGVFDDHLILGHVRHLGFQAVADRVVRFLARTVFGLSNILDNDRQ